MVDQLPLVNASLNGISLGFMLAAFGAIKARRESLHRALMTAAIVTSTAFLASYLVYHFGGDPKSYTGSYPIAYYSMLASHVILAALVPILVIVVVWRAWKGNRQGHRKLARIALPIWLYVSLTGVLIYVMVHT